MRDAFHRYPEIPFSVALSSSLFCHVKYSHHILPELGTQSQLKTTIRFHLGSSEPWPGKALETISWSNHGTHFVSHLLKIIVLYVFFSCF